MLIVSCALAGSTDSSPMYLFEKNHMEAEAPSAPVAKQPSPSVSYGVKLVYPMHAVAGRNKQEMPARIRLQLSAVSVRALRKLALPLLARSQLCGLPCELLHPLVDGRHPGASTTTTPRWEVE